MKLQTWGFLAIAGVVHGFSQEEYDTGSVMNKLMSKKYATWDREREDGLMDSSQYRSLPADVDIVKCVDNKAVVEEGNPLYTFSCNDLDLLDFQSHADLGSITGRGSSSWGWVSDDGREFAAIGQMDGTAFVEILPSGKMVYLGRLPYQSVPSIWREIRSYQHYMIIGSEAEDHYVQIFDMEKLLDISDAPFTFNVTTDLTSLFTANIPIGRVHNVNVNEEKQYAVAVGAQPRSDLICQSGLIFIDLTDPANPTSPGCASSDGYVHDAECVVYRGPDERYSGRDICYGYNEDTLTIYDVTNKTGFNASSIISRTTYKGASYTHQGAVTNREWQEYLLLDDELDEEDQSGPAADGYAVTYIFDIRDLENPVNTGYYKSTVRTIDHNQYVHGNYTYQSNYGSGLRVLDISSIPSDPTGNSIREVAYFDIYPEDDDDPLVEFVGTWSHYAGFPSGNILINTIERGAYIVRFTEDEPVDAGDEPLTTTTANRTIRTSSSTSDRARLFTTTSTTTITTMTTTSSDTTSASPVSVSSTATTTNAQPVSTGAANTNTNIKLTTSNNKFISLLGVSLTVPLIVALFL